MNILVVLGCMYLAGVFMNVIQVAKTYKAVDGKSMWVGGYFYAFAITFFHPTRVIIGTINAIRDWNWLEKRITKDAEGRFVMVKQEEREI